ncbi:hypothetical protein [Clostridium sp. Marseille-P2415]|uniref:hypothetical protein n=1 Tax=Clostridium sp. Marseille-P2415 TaxID=1805471 RepID=UPI0009884E9D|nr:hypothetical protein [Clostridium sp. Marseille-P2415]
MRENLFRKILKLEEKMADASALKSIISKRRKRKIIPEEYFIEVITVIPERKTVLEISEV